MHINKCILKEQILITKGGLLRTLLSNSFVPMYRSLMTETLHFLKKHISITYMHNVTSSIKYSTDIVSTYVHLILSRIASRCIITADKWTEYGRSRLPQRRNSTSPLRLSRVSPRTSIPGFGARLVPVGKRSRFLP